MRATYWGVAGWIGIAAAANLFAADGNGPASADEKPVFASRAQKVYETAKSRYEAQTNSAEAGVDYGRACYDWADYAASDGQRAAIAREGMAVCKELIARDSNSVAGHYYLGMNLGELAQTKKLGALKIVGQMEAEFKAALDLDEQYDLAGPDRNLGLLYLEAPGWLLSIGDKAKARQHLLAALRLAPDYPENALNWIEAELEWGEKGAALRGLKDLDELWPKAQGIFTGDHWASSWADWELRRENARKEASQPAADKHR